MSDEPVATLDRVLQYPNGLHDYVTVTVLYSYIDRLVAGRYYLLCHNRHGMFIVELNEAMTPEEAALHKSIVLDGFEEGVVMASYLMKCISGSGLDYIVHWAPFEHTVPFVMSFNDECTSYTTEVIH